MSTLINYVSLSFSFSLLSILFTIYPNITAENNMEEVVLVENAEVVVSVETEDDLYFFKEAAYNQLQQELIFKTKESTVQIRIYDELESMMYLLPVKSQKIKIGKSLFEKGEYRIVFDVNGDRKMYSSKLKVF